MKKQHCTLHPNVMLVTTPQADGGVTKWGCVICVAQLLERLHAQFSTALQTVELELPAPQLTDERVQFEEWAKLMGINLGKTTGSEKYYVSETTSIAWIAWLACERMHAPMCVEIPVLFARHEEPDIAAGYSPELLRKMAANNVMLRYDELSGVLLMRQWLPLSKFARAIQG